MENCFLRSIVVVEETAKKNLKMRNSALFERDSKLFLKESYETTSY